MVNNEKELWDFLAKKTDIRTANCLIRGGFFGKAEYPIQEKEIFMALKKALDSNRFLTFRNLGKRSIAKIRQAVADFKPSEENYDKLIGAILGFDESGNTIQSGESGKISKKLTCEEVLEALRKGKKITYGELNKIYMCMIDGEIRAFYKEDNKPLCIRPYIMFSDGEISNCSEYELYEKPPLDEVEKKYLSRILNPLKNSVRKITISKWQLNDIDREYIQIYFWDDRDIFDCWVFPEFEKGTMYAGMEPSRKYTLEELGL